MSTKETPQNEPSQKENSETKENSKEDSKENENSESKKSKKQPRVRKNEPLFWFGGFPTPTLRQSQKDFKQGKNFQIKTSSDTINSHSNHYGTCFVNFENGFDSKRLRQNAGAKTAIT